MTGIGHSEALDQGDQGATINVTVRSYNHKYLDISLRLRDEYRSLEPKIRALVKERLSRGRIELGIEIQPAASSSTEIDVDENLVSSFYSLCDRLLAQGKIAALPEISDLLRVPGAVAVHESTPAVSDDLVLLVIAEAVELLGESRGREGAELERVCARCVVELNEVIAALRSRRRVVVAVTEERLRSRLTTLVEDFELDPQRLHQEAMLMIDRSDVREELDRLEVHSDELFRLLNSGEAIGKRMGFLCQEVLRELNTIAAKSRDAELTSSVLDGKVVCEQLREQALNVE